MPSPRFAELCSSATFGRFQYVQKLPILATPRTAKVGKSRNCQSCATPRNCQSWQLPEIASFGIFCNWQMAKRSEQVLFIHFLSDFLLTKISKIGHFTKLPKLAMLKLPNSASLCHAGGISASLLFASFGYFLLHQMWQHLESLWILPTVVTSVLHQMWQHLEYPWKCPIMGNT